MSSTHRPAVAWCTYPGTIKIDRTKPMGPNTLGEALWPVEATYDAEENETRVGFSYVAPETSR